MQSASMVRRVPNVIDPSQPLANTRHEAFALALATGNSASEAYRRAGYGAKDANSKGSRLAANDSIQARRLWIQHRSASVASLTLREARELLAAIARNPALRPCDRIAAIRVDNDLAGHGCEAKANEAVGTMADVMARIRAKRWK